MGCTQSSAQPKVQPEEVKVVDGKPAKTAEPTEAGEADEHKLKAGDKVSVSLNGGFEGEVVQCTTTDVLVKGPGSKEQWCEMEDVQVTSSGTDVPPLQREVQVGQAVSTARGVAGSVTKRTTTEVCVRTPEGEGVWVAIEDISFLRVCIQAASCLRNADVVSKSDPYCVCQLEGKPESKVQTATVSDSLNPAWNFEARMVSYVDGDALTFEVFDRDLAIKKDDFLGRARLTTEQIRASGFHGDLELEDELGKPCKGALRVQVRLEQAADIQVQPEAEPPTRHAPKEAVVEEVKASPPQHGWCC